MCWNRTLLLLIRFQTISTADDRVSEPNTFINHSISHDFNSRRSCDGRNHSFWSLDLRQSCVEPNTFLVTEYYDESWIWYTILSKLLIWRNNKTRTISGQLVIDPPSLSLADDFQSRANAPACDVWIGIAPSERQTTTASFFLIAPGKKSLSLRAKCADLRNPRVRGMRGCNRRDGLEFRGGKSAKKEKRATRLQIYIRCGFDNIVKKALTEN